MKRVQFKHQINEKKSWQLWLTKPLSIFVQVKNWSQKSSMVKSLNQLKNCAVVTGFISSPTVKAYQLYMMSRRFLFTFLLFTFFRCLKNIRSCKCFVDGMNSCVTNFFFLLFKDNCTQLSVHILRNMLVSTLLFLSDVPSHRKRAMDKK